MLDKNYFLHRKILVFGLGILGGGVSLTNWLLRQGADVTITDLKDESKLGSSLQKINGKIKLRLGEHRAEDIDMNEMIIFNPDVNLQNPFFSRAVSLHKKIENEATLFYQLCDHPIVAITGTRGKTTTTSWTQHFLNSRFTAITAGNNPISPLFLILDEIKRQESKIIKEKSAKQITIVNELPSYHLELFDNVRKSPQVAVITNLFADHLNRHGTLEEYASVKAKIFSNQTEKQNLILNFDDSRTAFFLAKKPRSMVWYFRKKRLPKGVKGVYYSENAVFFRDSNGASRKILELGEFIRNGEHNLENLLTSSLAAYLMGVSWDSIQTKISNLPKIPYRQETICKNERVEIVNDTAATSPEGSLAAIKRFSSETCVLITGGTDRELDFGKWGKEILQYIFPQNIIMLAGSATDKMLKEIGAPSKKIRIFETLAECVNEALIVASEYPKAVILFSPGAKSFEKFKNEWDRGEKFNEEIRKWFNNE